jgi:response regulator RpfG family c-di-GMP phosphodiesterase
LQYIVGFIISGKAKVRLNGNEIKKMEMSPGELIHVRRGALLHDIGKMGITDSILQKPG